jgi:hypothetical protein
MVKDKITDIGNPDPPPATEFLLAQGSEIVKLGIKALIFRSTTNPDLLNLAAML